MVLRLEASLRSVALTSCSNWVVQRARSKNEVSSFRRHQGRSSNPCPAMVAIREIRHGRRIDGCSLVTTTSGEISMKAPAGSLICSLRRSSDAVQQNKNYKSNLSNLHDYRKPPASTASRQAIFFNRELFDELSSFRSCTSSVTPFKSFIKLDSKRL